jgi:hypothetical protein
MHVNKTGFQVTYTREDGTIRTYACTDWRALDFLVTRLTGRPLGSTPFDYKHLRIPGFKINTDFHIYGIQGPIAQTVEAADSKSVS